MSNGMWEYAYSKLEGAVIFEFSPVFTWNGRFAVVYSSCRKRPPQFHNITTAMRRQIAHLSAATLAKPTLSRCIYIVDRVPAEINLRNCVICK